MSEDEVKGTCEQLFRSKEYHDWLVTFAEELCAIATGPISPVYHVFVAELERQAKLIRKLQDRLGRVRASNRRLRADLSALSRDSQRFTPVGWGFYRCAKEAKHAPEQ